MSPKKINGNNSRRVEVSKLSLHAIGLEMKRLVKTVLDQETRKERSEVAKRNPEPTKPTHH